jgi:hypothetical protein
MSLKQNKKKIMELLEQLDWMFGTQNFDRSVVFEEDEEYYNGDPVSCKMTCDESYQVIKLHIYPNFFEHELPKQRRILLHEFVHTTTIPLYRTACNLHDGQLCTPEQIRQEHERATSRIDNILDRLLSGGMTYAKKAYKEYLK